MSRSHRERARYAEAAIREDRADPRQRNVGGTRESRRAEHVDRAGDRGPSINETSPPNTSGGAR
jgi:hypothetical protein